MKKRKVFDYPMKKSPGHPRAGAKGWVKEHLLIAEKALGRPLQESLIVHHADGNHLNNKNSNLVICKGQSYHMLLHKRLRAFRATGKPRAEKCVHCRKWEDPENITLAYSKGVLDHAYHKACRAKASERYRRKKGVPVMADRKPTKLTEEIVVAIKKSLKNGETTRHTAKKFKISQTSVWAISSGRLYASIGV